MSRSDGLPEPRGPGDPSLARREVLTWLGAAGGTLLLGTPRLSEAATEMEPERCVLTPRQTEGPYFVDERLERSDLRTDPADGSPLPGVPLELVLHVHSVRDGTCTPLTGAIVDLWHCDAQGHYSDVRDPWFGVAGKKFLRGFQRSDAAGKVRFTTIYPGWYPGRAVHVHFKVRTAHASAETQELTSQLYFDESVTRRVHQEPPYAARGPAPPNRTDGIFQHGGDALTLKPERAGPLYRARFEIGLRAA